MKQRFIFFPALLSLFCLLLVSGAMAAGLEGKSMVFATSYQESRPVAGDVLALGYVNFLPDNKARISRYIFRAVHNLRPREVAGHTPKMSASYGPKKCKNKTFMAPSADTFAVENGRWSFQQGEVKLFFAGLEYRWVTDQLSPSAFKVSAVLDGRGGAFRQAVGYAFLAGALDHSSRLKLSDMAERYDGDIFHKTTRHFAKDNWLIQKSGFTTTVYRAQSADRDLFDFSRIGHPQARKRLKTDLWAHHALLLNSDAHSKLIIYHDYGHDFNMNGCYDEQGHNKVLMGVPDNNHRIEQLVYIEYTHDKFDGYPMLSVGRYYATHRNR